MSVSVRILTDSTCDVPLDVAQALGVTVVPVYINIGDKSYLDGVDLSRREFFTQLPTYESFPTTATPSSGTFAESYRQLAAEGATDIISMHIAADLSSTINAARLGAQEVPEVNVVLFDTQQITMGSGLQVIAAAEAAAAGASATEINDSLISLRAKTRIYALLDTLEFLRRSGRVSWAQFGLGSLLRIKPVMTVHAGEVEVIERPRTRKRALRRVISLVEEQSPIERIAVLHANNLELAVELQQSAQHLFPDGAEPLFVEITPAIGAHIGPGAVGLAFTSGG